MVYPSLISKSKEFSQSISRVVAGDTIEGTQISGYGDRIEKITRIARLQISQFVVVKSNALAMHYIKRPSSFDIV